MRNRHCPHLAISDRQGKLHSRQLHEIGFALGWVNDFKLNRGTNRPAGHGNALREWPASNVATINLLNNQSAVQPRLCSRAVGENAHNFERVVSHGKHNSNARNRRPCVVPHVKDDEKRAHQNRSNQNYYAPFSHDV